MVTPRKEEDNTKHVEFNIEKTKEHFEEYSSNSIIHGIRYLGERERPLVEKIWWIIAFIISISICVSFILTLYKKWDEEPVIVSFESKPMPLFEIPFPAVTLCPEIRSMSEMFNFSDTFVKVINNNGSLSEILNEEEKFHFESLMHICSEDYTKEQQLHRFDNISTPDHVEDIYKVSVPISISIMDCYFGGVEMPCSEIFTELLTEEGVCFNFNLIQAREIFKKYTVQHDYEFLANRESNVLNWNFDTGYADNSENSYPFRAVRQGKDGGLMVLLYFPDEKPDYKCGGFNTRGFKIMLHSPSEFPKFHEQAHDIHMGKDGFITIKPEVVTISDGLKDYNPERRQCYFSDERFLYYYKTYTQANCEQECLSNLTLKRCGCVKFSLPREESTILCGAGKIQCYSDAKLDFNKFMFQGNNELTKTCNCLPNCNFVEYNKEFFETEVSWEELFQGIAEDYTNKTIHRLSRLTVSFDRHNVISILRSERYGLSDFISNCGGLLGLFMGISILSVVEIIYYCTVRLICNLRKKQENKDEDEEETIEIQQGPKPEAKLICKRCDNEI